MKRPLLITLALALCLLLAGCIRDEPVLMPDFTLPPVQSAAPAPTPSPTPEPTPTPLPALTLDPNAAKDALGAEITGLHHYEQYLYFRNIQVYEQHGDTFMDAVIYSAYPEVLVCAVTLNFYEEQDEDATPPPGGWTDGPVASAALQTRDGQYVLKLAPGENTVFAQVNTDMTLTGMDFTLTFDASLGVYPE